MTVLSRLKGEGVLLFHHDFRNGSYQDLSGNGKHGTPTGCQLTKGSLPLISGGSQVVSAGASNITAGARTIFAYFNYRSAGYGNTYGRVFDCGSLFFMCVAPDFIAVQRNGGARVYANISTNEDHLVVCTWDASGIADLWVDGVLEWGDCDIGTLAAPGNMYIGNRGTLDRQFDGLLYTVGAVNRELTTDEIAELETDIVSNKPDTRQIVSRSAGPSARAMTGLGNGARETASNAAVGEQIPGTPFYVGSGTWSVGVETVNGKPSKVIECETAGIIYADWGNIRNSRAEAAYGTWEYLVYKLDGNTSRYGLSLQDVGAYEDATNNGYGLAVNSVERVRLSEVTAGTITNVISTDTDSFPVGQWVAVKTTRSPAGAFNVYVDGSLVGSVTDATHTSGRYVSFDVDAGDKIALSTLSGEPLFRKHLIVV